MIPRYSCDLDVLNTDPYPGRVYLVAVHTSPDGQRLLVELSNGVTREYRVAHIATGRWHNCAGRAARRARAQA